MALTAAAPARWVGPLFAVIGTLGFSFKAILIKLAYAWHPVDALTLLALRMLYSAPFFVAMAWWASRRPGNEPLQRRDWIRLAALGFVGYYLASLLDFMGLAYISAALERLVLFLYPTMVVLLSALLLKKPVARATVFALLLSYGGIVFVFWHDLRVAGDAGAVATGGALVFGSAFCYAVYLVGAGDLIGRIGSTRFIALAMLASTAFVLAQFALIAAAGGAGRAGLDPRAVAGDGGVLDRAADVAGRRGDPPHRRQRHVAGGVAGARVHHRHGRGDPGRAAARGAAPRRGAGPRRGAAGHAPSFAALE